MAPLLGCWNQDQRRRRCESCKVTRSIATEHQLPALGIHAYYISAAERAGQDLLRQRVLELLLERALERAGAVHRIEADVAQQVERLVRQLDPDPAFGQALVQPA